MESVYFIGIDIGTQGARVVTMDQQGNQVAAKEEVFPLSSRSREEQSSHDWWSVCWASLRALCREAKGLVDLSQMKAIAVTSTSGTIIPLDGENEPLHNAIMYSDGRQQNEGIICTEAAQAAGIKGYTAFNTSSGLSKMVWWLRTHPRKVLRLNRFVHAADFITGKLSGNFAVTDYTNALKSGYDLQELRWPDYLVTTLGLRREWLPAVAPSGIPIGTLQESLAHVAGLPAGIIITAGITDGCASQLASGAVNAGDWNTTIGTRLVVKGVTNRFITDPSGALYCHRHPEGYWMPGGASNTGADWVSRLFGDQDLSLLNEAANGLIPTGQLAWPLMQEGERFPFVAPQARGFAPEGISGPLLFAAYMEGVAYIERFAYEKIRLLGGENVERVFTAGGGSQSDTWLTIRSNVLNLPLCKMKHVSGAAGAAVLAASKTCYSSLAEAAAAMVRPEKQIHPNASMVTAYEENYHRFIHLLQEKGYLTC